MSKKIKFTKTSDIDGVFNTSLEILNALLRKQIDIPRAEVASNLLTNANRSFALKLKYAEMTKDPEGTMKSFAKSKIE